MLINVFFYIVEGDFYPKCNGHCLDRSLRHLSNGHH